jgi:1-acyl-sn-glycerol-3-phosphate acyltransferase
MSKPLRPSWNWIIFRLQFVVLYMPMLLSLALYRTALRIDREFAQWVRFHVPRFIAQLILRSNRVNIRAEGLEHLKDAQGRGRLVLCNHTSRLDGYILLATLPRAFKMFRSNKDHMTVEGYSFLSWWTNQFDMFFIHNKDNARETAKEFRLASDYLGKGNALAMFPEGMKSSTGRVHPFGNACFKLALRSGASIAPTIILGSAALFEHSSKAADKRLARVIVLPPREVPRLQDAKEVEDYLAGLVKEMNLVILREAKADRDCVHLLAPEAPAAQPI